MTIPMFHKPVGAAPDKPKRKKSVSQTSRALQELKSLGYTAEKVEQRVPIRRPGASPFASFTRDFINVIDIIAFRPGSGILGVQVTSGSGGNHAARRTKMLDEPMLRMWLDSGGRAEIWSYAKQGPRGEVKRWKLRREEITAIDMGVVAIAGGSNGPQ